MKVMSRDSGMETAVTSVERTDIRNTRMTATAKPRPSRPSVVRSLMDFSMNGAWSNTGVNLALDPSSASSWPMESFTACEIATVSPSGFLVTESASVSLPLVRVIDVRTSSLMLTSATLPMVAASLAPPSGRALTASRESTGLPICSESVLPCSSMVPAGISAPLFFSALLMDWMVAPLAAMASGRGRIWMCWLAPPVTSAPLTPSSFWSRGTLRRCRSAFSSLSGLSEETARNTIGKSLMLPAMACGWTSSGRARLALEMARSIWFRARSRFEPYVNTMVICETPVREVDDVDSSPSTPFSAVSRGPLTCLSTTSGEAPGMAEMTVICGNSMEGMSSCLSEDMVITPNTDAKTVISAIRALFASDSFASRYISLSPGGLTVLWLGVEPAVTRTGPQLEGASMASSWRVLAVSASSRAASSGLSLSLMP
ncbi:hypothetical protein D9M72_367410 [compost metagenome]